MTPIVLIVGGLITWRVSYALVKETGPLAVFARFRAHLAQKQKRMGGLYDMFSCISCVSVYVGAVAALPVSGGFLEWAAYTLSFSAVTLLTERLSASKA